MNQEELEKFNIELKALLIKYDANLKIAQVIQVEKNPVQQNVTPKIKKVSKK
jgi:hypothetical protein